MIFTYFKILAKQAKKLHFRQLNLIFSFKNDVYLDDWSKQSDSVQKMYSLRKRVCVILV